MLPIRDMYALACRVEGTCSLAAIRYGLKMNRGLGKLRFLKSRAGEVWRWIKRRVRCWVCERKEQKSITAFAASTPGVKVGDIIKPIAFYLPQFHTFPENDTWWGKGFTEWTNVRKAKPLFKGHYQPHVPHPDVGYYDLSDVEVMRRQAAMAKKYGIYGFCFYYYHFANGKRLLEKPVNNWLASKDIDFPFCFCWANENWTRTWDGGEKDIIMPQDYGRDNMVAMFETMLEAFSDPRYIKVGPRGNTPVLLVYRAEIVSEMSEVAREWRRLAKAAGFDGIYLISVQNFEAVPPATMGMDAATDFPAGRRSVYPFFSFNKGGVAHLICKDGKPLNAQPYMNLVRWCERPDQVPYVQYKAVAPSWDNSPRRAERGLLFFGSSPSLFGRALSAAVKKTLADPRLRENGFLFLNAWNEWGEGAHLEPDERMGYEYLETLSWTLEQRVNGR